MNLLKSLIKRVMKRIPVYTTGSSAARTKRKSSNQNKQKNQQSKKWINSRSKNRKHHRVCPGHGRSKKKFSNQKKPLSLSSFQLIRGALTCLSSSRRMVSKPVSCQTATVSAMEVMSAVRLVYSRMAGISSHALSSL